MGQGGGGGSTSSATCAGRGGRRHRISMLHSGHFGTFVVIDIVRCAPGWGGGSCGQGAGGLSMLSHVLQRAAHTRGQQRGHMRGHHRSSASAAAARGELPKCLEKLAPAEGEREVGLHNCRVSKLLVFMRWCSSSTGGGMWPLCLCTWLSACLGGSFDIESCNRPRWQY